ncbi:nitrile hydratase subunit alpha [Hansschlegelia plantiphila]|uniref:nitrile hydratase n=1 Tax=Hansschlegelia plantiphila TaxID=374655 RepID=A0A9W6MVL5_9HYPH|nr:nitrile hydratase subunit alpha [Hansschlegelia plantiphila]GLK68021.1 nitrile hydratase subunit alpha [Hansschlegelia plantiphila]
MSGHDHDGHDHDPHHDHRAAKPWQAVRTEALESILNELGVLSSSRVDEIVAYYEDKIGQKSGARVVARAWTDPAFKARLLADGLSACAELGLGGPETEYLHVVENTPTLHNIVVCTLCSCYPWTILGLPPAWYKSSAYRSRAVREPRKVLAEMGLSLGDDVTIQVWDSVSEIRYLVLPERPAGTESLTEAELADIVTRDAMIGVARVQV